MLFWSILILILGLGLTACTFLIIATRSEQNSTTASSKEHDMK